MAASPKAAPTGQQNSGVQDDATGNMACNHPVPDEEYKPAASSTSLGDEPLFIMNLSQSLDSEAVDKTNA